MQKTITKFIILLAVLILALGVNYIFAAWTGPTQAPPQGNTPTPIHVGTTNQVKNGGLSLNALSVFGNGYFQGNVGIGTVSPTEKLDVSGNIRISNLPDCASLATDSNGKIICAPVSTPPVACTPGSQNFATPGEFSIDVNDSMENCIFTIVVKGAGGGSGSNLGGIGGGAQFTYNPSTTGTFGILVGYKGLTNTPSLIGGGGAAYGGGGGASAVKFNNTVLAISGGGGGGSWGGAGGAGGSLNGSGSSGSGGTANGSGGGNNIGGAGASANGSSGGTGGSNSSNGGSGSGSGGVASPAYMISGGGGAGYSGASYAGGAGGGGYGGGGGSGGGWPQGGNSGGGGGGGGGYINTGVGLTSIIQIAGTGIEKDGNVSISWQ